MINDSNQAVAISAQEAVSPGAEGAPVDALHREVSSAKLTWLELDEDLAILKSIDGVLTKQQNKNKKIRASHWHTICYPW